MAHLVSAEGAEGAETGAPASPQTMDINAWLKANRLNKLKDYFETAEIEMEDLLSFTETDIEFRNNHRSEKPNLLCYSFFLETGHYGLTKRERN